jgi:IS4 transposase
MTPLPEISVTVVFAREENPPSGQQPVEWMLLTTRTVTTLAQARVIIGWYRCQWEIEVFFRTLNTVCRVERLQLTHADRLKPAIALYLIIAWRLLYLTKLARTRPDVPDSVVFEDQEWRLAYNDVKRQLPPKRTPSLREILRLFRATWRVPGS